MPKYYRPQHAKNCAIEIIGVSEYNAVQAGDSVWNHGAEEASQAYSNQDFGLL